VSDVRREVVLDEDVAALIRQVHQQRLALKMSRRACSHKSGLTERAIYKIETLTVNPGVDTFMLYAAAVGLHLALEYRA
jgi:transcriptional regulator with XRE-family HTH domain